MKSVCSFTLRR